MYVIHGGSSSVGIMSFAVLAVLLTQASVIIMLTLISRLIDWLYAFAEETVTDKDDDESAVHGLTLAVRNMPAPLSYIYLVSESVQEPRGPPAKMQKPKGPPRHQRPFGFDSKVPSPRMPDLITPPSHRPRVQQPRASRDHEKTEQFIFDEPKTDREGPKTDEPEKSTEELIEEQKRGPPIDEIIQFYDAHDRLHTYFRVEGHTQFQRWPYFFW